MTKIFKSFEELHAHLNPSTKGTKATMPAMMVECTVWIDHHALRPATKDIRLLKVMPNGKVRTSKIKHGKAKKYMKGNADGSTTFIGRNMISTVAYDLMK